jgi:hypothetical protein
VTGSGTSTIRVDGFERTADSLIGSGVHRVEIDWLSPMDLTTYFELDWGPAPTALEPVPASAITPPGGRVPPMRVLLWVLALVVGLAGAAAAFLSLRARGSTREMIVRTSAVIALVVLAIGIRAIDYDVMPDWRDNADEQLASWNGFSLLTTGRPESWTLWPGAYGGAARIRVTKYFGQTYHLVSPYFEHPPLTHVLVGAAAVLGGAHSIEEVRLTHVRVVPILLAALNVLLIVLVGRRVDRRPIARGGIGPYVGALLYAVLPSIAIQTRVVKEEILLTPMILGCVLCFLRFRESNRRSDLAIASVLAGLAILTKVPGFALVIALSILVLHHAGLSAMLFSLSISVPISLLWPLYGALYDFRLFTYTQEVQASARSVTFLLFERFFDVGIVNHNLIGRGWTLFLWLATMSSLYRRSAANALVIATPLFAYLAAIGLGSGSWTYGWYVTPLLPWLTLGAGIAMGDLWERPELGRAALFVFLLVFYSLAFAAAPLSVSRPVVTGALLALFAPFALAAAAPSDATRFVARLSFLAGLAIVVAVSIGFVLHYDVLERVYHDLDVDPQWGR